MLTLDLGDASQSPHDADIVFGHVLWPLPPQLVGKPAIVNIFGSKNLTRLVGADLVPVSTWGHGQRNTIFVANVPPAPIDLTDLVEDLPVFMPLELPLRLLRHYARPGMTVWNGGMGRGTVGRACQQLGLNYIGVEIDPARFAQAKEYLGA